MGVTTAADLFRILANSDAIVKPVMGCKNLVYAVEAGCMFVGPEENKTLSLKFDCNRPGSLYRLKAAEPELSPGGIWMEFFGVEHWTFEVHRNYDTFPKYPGETHFPVEVYNKLVRDEIQS
tara:strand:- start:423 stop:785 length:363 start_codon:yes stop_codon:yes gene_type:complete